MTQFEEYKQMGFELMPSGRINHHLWYGRKYGHCSMNDSTWKKEGREEVGKYHRYIGHHTCCGSRKAYCHKVGCKNRREILGDDDYSDLKEI